MSTFAEVPGRAEIARINIRAESLQVDDIVLIDEHWRKVVAVFPSTADEDHPKASQFVSFRYEIPTTVPSVTTDTQYRWKYDLLTIQIVTGRSVL